MKRTLKVVGFCCLLVLAIGALNLLFQPLWFDWNGYQALCGLYSQQPQTIEAVVVGSSLAGRAISPVRMYERAGICSYNLSSPQQPAMMSYYWAKEAYIAKETEKIASGKLNIEKVLSQKTLKKEFPTPEEKEKVYNREIHRALVYRYNKIEDTFRKRYKPSLRGFFKYPIKVCGKALSLTSEGFVIDVEKFIEIYGDYLEANDSQTGKQHQEAADAINRFFNGQVEITDKEMERYFILEDGIVKPNPKSINREGYIRLGYRGKTKVNKT